MFAKHKCFPMFCFLNQREGLVANRDNIAKNTADITILKNNINSGMARLKALPPTISKNAVLVPKHIAEYQLLPARAMYAESQLLANTPDSKGSMGIGSFAASDCDFAYNASFH